MIGNSVVPGLPNRCVMPSSLSSARNAERPVMRFMKVLPPRGRCRRDRRQHGRSRMVRSMDVAHGCPAQARARAVESGAWFMIELRFLTGGVFYVINRLHVHG